jgi:hypothetical protein
MSESGLVVIAFLTAGGSIMFWIIKSKISEEFLTKDTYQKNCEYHQKDCANKHGLIEGHVDSIRAEMKEDIKEIKIMINNIQTWMMEFVQRKESK